MSMGLTYDKSTLVQVMAWCRQATSHYLCQCWPRSVSPYGVNRPQWVKLIVLFSKSLWYLFGLQEINQVYFGIFQKWMMFFKKSVEDKILNNFFNYNFVLWVTNFDYCLLLSWQQVCLRNYVDTCPTPLLCVIDPPRAPDSPPIGLDQDLYKFSTLLL